MKQIEEYVHSVYRNVDGNKQEVEELKEEMRSHLLEHVYELQGEGKSEEEAVKMAINQFGEKKQMVSGLSEFFSVHKRFARIILLLSLVAFVLGTILLVNTLLKINDFRQESGIIMNDVFVALDHKDSISDSEKEKIESIFNEHSDHVKYLAVFSTKENAKVQEFVTEYELTNDPRRVFPLVYQHAVFLIDDQGEIINKEEINSSTYDLGSIASVKNDWVVQYEYKESYREVIEEDNSLVLGDYMEVFPYSIVYYVVFVVLLIIWAFLKRFHRKYFIKI